MRKRSMKSDKKEVQFFSLSLGELMFQIKQYHSLIKKRKKKVDFVKREICLKSDIQLNIQCSL